MTNWNDLKPKISSLSQTEWNDIKSKVEITGTVSDPPLDSITVPSNKILNTKKTPYTSK